MCVPMGSKQSTKVMRGLSEEALWQPALTLVSNKRIKKAGRALPASSSSPAEQTGERNSQARKM